MRKLFFSVWVICFVTACTQQQNNKADIIYFNAKIWTGDSANASATAIAIKGNQIVFTGSDYKAFQSAKTKLIDLGGKLVVPGFTDNHTHFIASGYNLGSVNLREVKTKTEFIQLLKNYAALIPAGRWIVGGNWDHENWGGDLPTRQMIDSVSNGHPVFISRLDGHMALANTIALQKAEIDKQTISPKGGTIVKDAAGEPTGILKDDAMTAVYNVIPPLTETELDEALLRAQDYALSLGVTQVHDMVSYDGFIDIETWRRNLQQNKIKMRAYQFVPLRAWARLDSFVKRNGRGDDQVRWGGLKGYADGSLGSTTAWFYKPYLDEPRSTGLMVTDTALLRQWIREGDKAGLQVAIHAIGDRANDFIQECYTDAINRNGKRDRRFRIEHAQHLSEKGIAGFGQLGVIASIHAIHLVDDGKWAWKRIDADRVSRTYALKSLLGSGARVTLGSDWDVADLNPLHGIYAAVTRRTNDAKNPGGWVGAQKITVEQALRCYTVNNAYAGFMESKSGQLKAGMLADFVVLDQDIFSIPPEQIKDVKVLRTIAGGVEVFTRK